MYSYFFSKLVLLVVIVMGLGKRTLILIWEFYGSIESVKFWNCHAYSSKPFELFFNLDFSPYGCSNKGVYEVECWKGG